MTSYYRRGALGAPTAWATFEHMAVVEQTIEHGSDCRHIAQQFSPVLDGAIRG
jgi:hypothetical protein